MKRHDESTSDRLRRMAATDELSVGRGRAEHVAARALARAVSRPRSRMLAAAIAGSAFAVVSVTGIGAIADQAVPGDSLYAIDRAYESVGRVIGRHPDRTQETLIEALTLARRGDRERANLHLITELGAFNEDNPYGLNLPEPGDATTDLATPATTEVTSEVVTTQPATPAAAAAQAAEPVASDTTSTTVAAAVVAEQADGDPLILALERALRASQLAVETPDQEATLAAAEAVKSVVKLAASATETTTGQQAQAAPTLSSTTTTVAPSTTTTKPKADGNGAGTTTTTTVVTNSSTTTTVPNDSGTTTPGDGETAGGNSGGSQQGSGSSGGSGSVTTQPPIILPIP